MNLETVLALIGFVLVASLTPGPNNIMLMSSGANYGFRRTLPHLLGVNLGFCFMLFLIGIGLMRLFHTFPLVETLLKFVCAAFLLYLAYRIAISTDPVKGSNPDAHPMTFMQGVLFQWVNPKAWSVMISANTLYAPDNTLQSVLVVVLAFLIIGSPAGFLWTLSGLQLRKWLHSPARMRAFNLTMAGLLVTTLVPIALMA